MMSDDIKNKDLSEIQAKKAEILAAFQCQQTGNCCRADGYVYASGEEIEKMAAFLGIDTQAFMDKYVKKKNGWLVLADLEHRPNCFLTKNNLCQIHSCRPEQCRTYPDWPEIWDKKEHFYAEVLLCKGLQRAIKAVFRWLRR